MHMLIGHAGAPLSWAMNPETPPFYDAVELRHGYLRVRANRTALTMQARLTPCSAASMRFVEHWHACACWQCKQCPRRSRAQLAIVN